MQAPIIRADLDLTTLIYMIAVVFWIFGKMFSKKNKSGSKPGEKRTAERRPPVESTAEAELRDFLERMGGRGDELEEEEEIVEVSYEPEPVQQPRYEAPVRTPELNMDDAAEIMAENTRRTSGGMGSAFAKALRSTGSQFKLTEANISVLKEAMRSSHPVPANPIVTRKDLKDKKMFRKAMAAQIVLGTPRAFETSDVPEAIRH